MTMTNAQTTALIDAIAADKSLGAAQETFAKRIVSMIESGWTPGLMEEYKPGIVTQIAHRILTKTELTVFLDTKLAIRPKGVRSDRGNLVHRCEGVFSRMRKALDKALSAGEGEALSDGEGKAKGARGPNDPVARVKKLIEDTIKTVKLDQGKDASERKLSGHTELLAALKKASDMVAPSF
jgi:hypothetical protein